MAWRGAATRRMGLAPDRSRGLAIGGLATIVGGIVYALGWLDRLNGYNLDLHFRHLSTIEADPRIVLIDIDDLEARLDSIDESDWRRDDVTIVALHARED